MADVDIESRSLYKVLALCVHQPQKHGNYIKGYIDGEDSLERFLKDYCNSSNTKFIVRTSCKKAKEFSSNNAGTVTNCTRYGQTDRIYWEFNNRNLFVPFSGTPFVINSSQVKQCQYGTQYYKLRAEKIADWSGDDVTASSRCPSKQRTSKMSKKRNCPACMSIRELVLFPEYALERNVHNASKHVMRKEKAKAIANLKRDLQLKKIATVHRFFVHVPLPEAHCNHPADAGLRPARTMDPFIKAKLDELLSMGYEVRHIQIIVQDYISEALMKNTASHQSMNSYPSTEEITDYIYLSKITAPTVVEVQTKIPYENGEVNADAPVQMHKQLRENLGQLKTLIETCNDDTTLKAAKLQMRRVIARLRKTPSGRNPTEQSKKHRHAPYDDARGKQLSDTEILEMMSADAFNARDLNSSGNNQSELVAAPSVDTNQLLPISSTHLVSNVDPPETSMLTSFNRLMESDQDVLPSLVEHVVADSTQFHQVSLPVCSALQTVPHLYTG